MRLLSILVVAGAIATLCGSALAVTLGTDPAAAVLRKSDFPTTAKYTWGRMPALFGRGLASSLGIKAEGAFLAVEMPLSATKYQRVDGLVVTTASPAEAKRAYASFKSQLDRGSRTQRLPAFGDEQVVVLEPSVSRAKLLVRKGRVVWQLEVGGYGLLVIPRGTLLVELQKYAKKQKTRVGAG
jgi:hypothetical protein